MGNGSSPKGHDHVVQFYGDDHRGLVLAAGAHLAEAVAAGGAAIIVAEPARADALLAYLRERFQGDDGAFAERVVALDALATLAAFMIDGRPDPDAFDAEVGRRVGTMCERHGRVRAYGEMVGRLWRERAFVGALRLEQLWNDLLERCDVGLFCGYPIDVLGDEFQIGAVRGVLAAHTAMLPSLSREFGAAMNAAMDDVLGTGCHGLRAVVQHGFPDLEGVPGTEATILRLRHSLPRYADAILAKALHEGQTIA